jgi:hypothetical protein
MSATFKRVLGACFLALLFLATTLSPARAAEDTGWRIAYTSPGFPGDRFEDVVATGVDSAWAVGTAPCCNEADQMLIGRWDGTQWQVVTPPKPPPGTRYPSVFRVGASSDTDVWVFGAGADTSRFGSHWDGASWTTTDFGSDFEIYDAVVPAPNDAWVVGTSWDGSKETAVAQHFDGSAWTTIPMPGVAERLSGVAANDVWAIGRTADYKPITMRWNGRSWRMVALPKLALDPGVSAHPGDILALGHDDVWATAVLGKDEGVWPGPVLMHWNGRRWRQVKIDAPADSLYRLAPDGKGGLWIVSGLVHAHPYLLHYSEGMVTRQLAPAEPGTTPGIESIVPVPGTRALWAVGSLHHDSGSSAATVFRYDP